MKSIERLPTLWLKLGEGGRLEGLEHKNTAILKLLFIGTT